MPNTFAYLVELAWPCIALTVLASRTARVRLASTTAWMMLLPVMFLPTRTELKLPGVPALDKMRLATLSVALGLYLFHRQRIAATRRHAWFGRLILGVLLVGTVMTVMTNGDTLNYGEVHLPGLTSYDVVSIWAAHLLDVYLPFAIGARVFRTEEDLRDLFRVVSACGLIYLPLAMLEVRLSPQLHNWFYGFFPHQFLQMMRGGSYRPLIFMPHALGVAFFAVTTFCAGLALRGVHDRCRPTPGWRVAGTALLLVLCKSMASILYAVFAFAMERPLRRRAGALVLVVILVVVVTFPSTRFTGLFPVQTVVELAGRVSDERAFSIDFRFKNEDELLRKAMQRPNFGWGTFGRNRVFTDYGWDVSVTDGQWIINLGRFGVVGLAAMFALTIVPVLTYVRAQRRLDPGTRMLLGQLAIIVTCATIDTLPNSWYDVLPLMYAGALFTLSRELSRRRADAPGRREAAKPAQDPRLAADAASC